MRPASAQKLLALAAVLGLITGCGSTSVNSVEPARSAAERHLIQDRRVIGDPSLAEAVQVQAINTATDTAGFLKVQVEVFNTTQKLQRFTYRVEWFDANGMAIRLPTDASIPMSLEGRETKFITATAPTPQAKDFRFRFLEPVS